LRSFISIFLIISCIAVISLKDSLRSIHSLLHYIPNPFHNHTHSNLQNHDHHSHKSGNDHVHSHQTHHHSKDHHQIDPSNEEHHQHSDSEGEHKSGVYGEHNHPHDHDVLEHLGLEDQKDESSADHRKKGEKESSKIQCYPGVYYQYDFNISVNTSEDYFPRNNIFLLIYCQIPPSPPPEYTLL